MLAYAANASVGGLIGAGWLPDACASAHSGDYSECGKCGKCGDDQADQTNHAEHASGSGESKGTHDPGHGNSGHPGDCHCACHLIAPAVVTPFGFPFVPSSRIVAASELLDEAAHDGPVIGIDHPPQLA